MLMDLASLESLKLLIGEFIARVMHDDETTGDQAIGSQAAGPEAGVALCRARPRPRSRHHSASVC
jgi:hypothetical protein